MASAADVASIVREALGEKLCEEPGEVFYSGTDTLTEGFAYLMGLNPGGDRKKVDTPIVKTIRSRECYSAYTQECWRTDCGIPGSHPPHARSGHDGLVRHQRNAGRIAEALGLRPVQLFAVNAVFARSRRWADLKKETKVSHADWWSACWRAHQRFLSIVRPRLLLTLGYGEGTSPFGLLKGVCAPGAIEEIGEVGCGGGRAFRTELDLGRGDRLPVRVIGLPHPSYRGIGQALHDELARESGGDGVRAGLIAPS